MKDISSIWDGDQNIKWSVKFVLAWTCGNADMSLSLILILPLKLISSRRIGKGTLAGPLPTLTSRQIWERIGME